MDRSKWLADEEIPVRGRRANPARRFAVVYLLVATVGMAGGLGFLGGFFYGAHKQKTAPVAPVARVSR